MIKLENIQHSQQEPLKISEGKNLLNINRASAGSGPKYQDC